MEIPWWVYLMVLVVIAFAIGIHMLPGYLAKLEAQDKARREALKAKQDEQSAED
jgi:hypothetical protein